MTLSSAITNIIVGKQITSPFWDEEYFDVNPLDGTLRYWNGKEYEKVEASVLAVWCLYSDWEIKKETIR